MKSFNCLRLAVTGLGLALAAASPASAQNVAADAIRKGMADRGTTRGFSIDTNMWYAASSDGEFRGLRQSAAHATVNGGDGWAVVIYIENLTDTPFCIRPKPQGLPAGSNYYVQTVNQIVEPRDKLLIVSISDPGYQAGGSYRLPFAYWPPNYDAPEGTWCRSNAPDGLQDWLDDASASWFPRSRRD
ncbi:hypothetical protein [Caulobacter henricii]|uniref:Uncharacterized protein n=1 Tax=Caulobacter henricii TaxID=69395 RepID=A0A0N7JHJ0_9CAUL|nr:hypothetical protein [Caulobacter henricii]ALL13530.1 hypothetical protein AQ619_09300 [Caulobacter henricii]